MSPNPLQSIRTFTQLVKYLRDELDWPIESDDFDDLTFDYVAEELGLDAKTAVKINEVKQLRPLTSKQPWGIFFVSFAPKQLPVVALRRILSGLVVRKRQSANKDQQAAWRLHDLLFISSYGESDHRDITFAHFAEEDGSGDLPTLRLLGWDDEDTKLKLDYVNRQLKEKLSWPDDDDDLKSWREKWSAAFKLRPREVIKTSQQLAIRLADLARGIRKRANAVLAVESANGSLRKMHAAFQEALIHDLTTDDFADMYAQTISYGLLTARISRPAGIVADNLADMVPVTNPFLKELLEMFLTVGGRKGKIDFDELGVNEVVQVLRDADMEAVLRDFGDRNPQEDPVIHFYELFLKEYDAKKRMQRGVFYTPRPVVSYIVRSLDELLRTEFLLADGLADVTTWGEMVKRHKDVKIPEGVSPDQDFVQILDPATGTGTFLVEAIDLIHKTLVAKWKAQGHGDRRLESLWNEYVPKHLLTRLHGYELLMAPYAIAHLKIGLKLYETGYRFRSDERARVYLTNALEPAQDFSGKFEFAIPALAHEALAVNAVKLQQHFTVIIGNPPYSVSSQNDGDWITQLCKDFKGGLEGERNIQPLSDDYIKFLRLSSYLLERVKFGIHGMVTNREYIQGVIHRGIRRWLLHSANQIVISDLHGQRGELLQNHGADGNVFDIEKGVAVGVFLFGGGKREVRFGEFLGERDRKTKVLSTSSAKDATLRIEPTAPYYFLKPWSEAFKDEYQAMPSLLEWFQQRPVTGFATHRDDFAIDFCKQELERRVNRFVDSTVTDATIRAEYSLRDTRDWHLPQSRARAIKDLSLSKRIIQCTYRPFDARWVIYSDDILEYSRRDAMQQISSQSPALVCSRIAKDEAFAHVFISVHPVEKISLSPKSSNNAQVFLSGCVVGQGSLHLIDSGHALVVPNDQQTNRESDPQVILKYLYAVLHSPLYRSRYAEYLKIDFPRVPLPMNQESFQALACLGGELIALHMLASSKVDHFITECIGDNDQEVEKVSWSKNTVWLDKAQTTGFKGVRDEVWNFHIGGYRVCEKWLKDRKGRKLMAEEISHYQKIVVALSESIRLMKKIDEVIEEHGGWPRAFAAAIN
jgi:predicted helicase